MGSYKWISIVVFFLFFAGIAAAAPRQAALTDHVLDISIIERVVLSSDPANRSYTDGATTVMPQFVEAVNGTIYITNNANSTILGDIIFTLTRQGGGITFMGRNSHIFPGPMRQNGNYSIRVTEIENGRLNNISINYTVTSSLPNPPVNATITYYEYGSGYTVAKNQILANTTTQLEVRANFINLGSGNISKLNISKADVDDSRIDWQYTYWYNGSQGVVNGANLTVFPYDILYWCNGGNQLGTTPATNNITCNFTVNTTINLGLLVDTPVLVDWQNMSFVYASNTTASGAVLKQTSIATPSINVSSVPGTIFVEKYKISDTNYSSDIAFASNVSPSDYAIKLNVSYLTLWVSGNYDPNNISTNVKGNVSDLLQTYDVRGLAGGLLPGYWVNSSAETGTGTPEMMDTDEIRWSILWGNSTKYNRSEVPIFWGRANYTLIQAVFAGLDYDGASGEFSAKNYSIFEKIYVVKGYILRVAKRVNPLGGNDWLVNISITNIGSSYTPLVKAYDYIPTNFSTLWSTISVIPGNMLYETASDPSRILNYTGNDTLATGQYKGEAVWWHLSPIGPGQIVNITYTVTGTGVYKTRDLFLIGIDPVQGFGQVAITPTAEITQATAAAHSSEALFALMSVLGVAVGTIRRMRS